MTSLLSPRIRTRRSIVFEETSPDFFFGLRISGGAVEPFVRALHEQYFRELQHGSQTIEEPKS